MGRVLGAGVPPPEGASRAGQEDWGARVPRKKSSRAEMGGTRSS